MCRSSQIDRLWVDESHTSPEFGCFLDGITCPSGMIDADIVCFRFELLGKRRCTGLLADICHSYSREARCERSDDTSQKYVAALGVDMASGVVGEFMSDYQGEFVIGLSEPDHSGGDRDLRSVSVCVHSVVLYDYDWIVTRKNGRDGQFEGLSITVNCQISRVASVLFQGFAETLKGAFPRPNVSSVHSMDFVTRSQASPLRRRVPAYTKDGYAIPRPRIGVASNRAILCPSGPE